MSTSLWTIGRPEDLRAELFARSLDVMVAAALPQPLVFAACVPETGALARSKCHGNDDVRPVQHLHEVAARDEQGDVAVPGGDHLSANNVGPLVMSRIAGERQRPVIG